MGYHMVVMGFQTGILGVEIVAFKLGMDDCATCSNSMNKSVD